jgi:hypothetical protein
METNRIYSLLLYYFYREDFTDLEWFNKMKSLGENLPNEYCDIFDRHGEVSEDYEDIMNVDVYILNN